MAGGAAMGPADKSFEEQFNIPGKEAFAAALTDYLDGHIARSRSQVLEGRFILGSAEECAAEVAKYQELGVEELILRCQWPGMPGEDALRAVRLFGREVLPRFVA